MTIESFSKPILPKHTLSPNTSTYIIEQYHFQLKVLSFAKTLSLMMPKFSPVRYTILTLEQPVPENKKVQRNAFKGGSGVEPAKYPPKVKSEKVFYNSRVLERD